MKTSKRRKPSHPDNSHKLRRTSTRNSSITDNEGEGSFQQTLLHELETRFEPAHLEVHDLSCWYANRKILGSKRFWHRSIKYNKLDKNWTVTVFSSPVLRMADKKRFKNQFHLIERLPKNAVKTEVIGSFDTEERAVKECQKALKLRNSLDPLELRTDKVKRSDFNKLESHYKIVLVSHIFHRKELNERSELVYKELLDITQSIESMNSCEVQYFKNIHTFGKRVKKLPIFKYLSSKFLLDLRTPAQWGATNQGLSEATLTERYGLSHSNTQNISVLPHLKMLSTGEVNRIINQGREEESSGSKGSIFGHFYHGLPEDVQDLLQKEMQDNDRLREMNQDINARKFILRKLKDNTEGSVVKKLEKRKREYNRAAWMMQRLFRYHRQRKCIKQLFWRQLAAMNIQRCYRGYIARHFGRAYRTVMTISAVLVQSVFRSHKSRLETIALREKYTRAVSKIQPIVRGFLSRQFVKWIRKHHENGVVIQRLVRGHLARVRVREMRKFKFKVEVVIPSASIIQRSYRGYVGRRFFKKIKNQLHHERVEIPAALMIQRVLRGHNGRKIARDRERLRQAAIRLQRHWKGYRRRQWLKLVHEARIQHKMATRISSLGKGYIARKVYKLKKAKYYRMNVLIPSAKTLQRVFRGYLARLYVYSLRREVESASIIQHHYRRVLKARRDVERWHEMQFKYKECMADKIQCFVRSYLARKAVHALRVVKQGKEGHSAIKIQSAYRSFRHRLRAKEIRNMLQIERSAIFLAECNEELEMITDDMSDSRADLSVVRKFRKRGKERLRELKNMRLDWELRMPEIVKELNTMNAEDAERGWTESFETEKYVIEQCTVMSFEDTLSTKMQIKEYENEIEDILLEIEDLEVDWEHQGILETGELEHLRRTELERAITNIENDRAAAVRKQRNRWKVKSTRSNVIRRQRHDVLKLMQDYDHPTEEEVSSITYEKRLKMKTRVRKLVKSTLKDRRNKKRQEIQVNGWRNANVLSTYDSIVENSRKIMDRFSLDARRVKTDLRADPAKLCRDCGYTKCECHRIEQERAQREMDLQALADSNQEFSAINGAQRTTLPQLPSKKRSRVKKASNFFANYAKYKA